MKRAQSAVQNNARDQIQEIVSHSQPRPLKPAGILLRAQPRTTLRNLRRSLAQSAVVLCAVYDCAQCNAPLTARHTP